jgi:hypothetical protein
MIDVRFELLNGLDIRLVYRLDQYQIRISSVCIVRKERKESPRKFFERELNKLYRMNYLSLAFVLEHEPLTAMRLTEFYDNVNIEISEIGQ